MEICVSARGCVSSGADVRSSTRSMHDRPLEISKFHPASQQKQDASNNVLNGSITVT